jgi:hypothetical protein
MKDAPDLTLTLNDHGFVSVRNKTPVVAPRAYPAGTHHPDGILIASGPGVARDDSRKLVRLIDIPAILLYSLDVPVPEDFEGATPRHLFTNAMWTKRPLRAGEATHPVNRNSAGDGGPSDAEREKILEQMRALGYLDA